MAAARLRAQLLTEPASTPEAVVERLLAVQAQDPRAFRLAVRSRTAGCTAEDVDTALTQRRSLVVSWLFRGTLHLVQATDYAWLHALTAPRTAPRVARRLEQLGVDAATTDRAVAVIVETLADGPRSRNQLRATLDAAGMPTAGQTLIHLLAAASLRAHVVRGPVQDDEHCFVDARRWLGTVDPPDPHTCLTALAQRYLAGHGPAGPHDLAAYAGIPLTQARRAFDLISDATTPTGEGLMALGGVDDSPELPTPRLLGMFDPILHGWADRDFVTGGHRAAVTTNGLFRATALVNGRVAGTWSLSNGTVTLTPLEPLPPTVLDDLSSEALDVLRFLRMPGRPLVLGPAAG
ncbi:winged helix DNA-binding domain-containing protein [Nocardioides sp. AN3]